MLAKVAPCQGALTISRPPRPASAAAGPAAFLIGCQWGLLGLTFAWVAVFPLVVLMNMSINYPRIGLRVRDVIHIIRTPVLAAAAMYGAVALVRMVAADRLPVAVLLVLLVATGGAAYPLVAFRLDPDLRREAMGLLRRR